MIYNDHSRLEGRHAFLSPSQHHWINYDDERLANRYATVSNATLGTRLHALAEELIKLGIKLPDNTKTFNMYVNDAIGYRMDTEVILYYSDYAFGTADAIKFTESVNGKPLLRIHDLKTGKTKVYLEQLEIYTAYFCLEYVIDPYTIDIILCIYQNDEKYEWTPEPDRIKELMEITIEMDRKVSLLESEMI